MEVDNGFGVGKKTRTLFNYGKICKYDGSKNIKVKYARNA